MTGDVTINNTDAYTRYGINFEDGALSALMTPAPNKQFIESKSRVAHGKSVITKNPKVDVREIVLPFHIVAKTKEEFFEKYDLFCEEVLEPGAFTLKSKYQPARSKIVNGVMQTRPQVVYHLIYKSCQQFKQYQREMAVFHLKVEEPNPKNRT
jgi:hypothetical protein